MANERTQAMAQYGFWLEEVRNDTEKGTVRDGVIMGLLTDAFNDPNITMPEYTRLVLEHADMFHDFNAIKTAHGDMIRLIVKATQVTAKKKGLVKK